MCVCVQAVAKSLQGGAVVFQTRRQGGMFCAHVGVARRMLQTFVHLLSQNALNIVPLNPGVTDVRAVDHSSFQVTLTGSSKSFRSVP